MPTLNDAKYQALRDLTGYTDPATLNDLERMWLLTETGYTDPATLNDLWLILLSEMGYEGSLGDTLYEFLGDLGYTGTLNDRLYQYWLDGGSGGGGGEFNALHADFTTTLIVVYTDVTPTAASALGWTCTVDGQPHTLTYVNFTSHRINFNVDEIPVGATVLLTYSGLGDTESNGTPLAAFTDMVVEEHAGSYAWAAAGSKFMLSDGNVADHVLDAQILGVGSPSFVTPPDLYLPDFEGVYKLIPAGSPPWHGARWVGDVAYGDDGSGVPLDPAPSLFGNAARSNIIPRSRDMTTTWSASSGAIATYDQVGIDGEPNSASRVNMDASSSSIRTSPATGVAGTPLALRLWLKRVGVPTGSITMLNDVAASVGQWDIDTSLISDTEYEAITESHPSVTVGSTFVRSASGTLGLSFRKKTSVSDLQFDVGNVEYYENLTEEQITGSQPIFTEGAAVSQAAIQPLYDTGNISDGQGAIYCELSHFAITAQFYNEGVITPAESVAKLLWARGGLVRFSDGATTTQMNYNRVESPDFNKLGSAYDSVSTEKGVNADSIGWTEGTYDGSFELTDDLVLAGFLSMPCLIRNVRRYDLPYAEAKAKVDELMSIVPTVINVGNNATLWGYSISPAFGSLISGGILNGFTVTHLETNTATGVIRANFNGLQVTNVDQVRFIYGSYSVDMPWSAGDNDYRSVDQNAADFFATQVGNNLNISLADTTSAFNL